jgi:hypothetical protein
LAASGSSSPTATRAAIIERYELALLRLNRCSPYRRPPNSIEHPRRPFSTIMTVQ